MQVSTDHDVFRRGQVDFRSGLGPQRDAPATQELLAVHGCVGGYVHVRFDEHLLVDQVEAGSLADGATDRVVDDVKIALDGSDEGVDVFSAQIRHEVDVESRTDLAVDRRGDRAADAVADAESLEHASHDHREGDRIGRHQPSRSGSQPKRANEASRPRARAA